jgi:hypothetical protein
MGRITEFLVFINASDKDLEYRPIHTPKWDYAYIDIKSPELKRLRREYRKLKKCK